MVKDMYGQKWNHGWAYYAEQYRVAPLHEIQISGVLAERKPTLINVSEGVEETVGPFPSWEELTIKEKRIWVAWVGNHNYKSPSDS